MDPLSGSILVLGLGKSGDATAAYVARHACAGDPVKVRVVDEADGEAQRLRAECLRASGIEVDLGVSEAPAADLVVASPGIPPRSALMTSARALGVEVISEVEFAYRRSVAPWIAVTGTNGKTTVTSMIAHLLAEAGRVAEPVGNIGQPAIAAVDDAGPASVLVAEVSSFQLSLTSTFRPRVSVLLNITPDHIDWHGSMDAYAEDKARVFANQGAGDTAVVDIDDPGSAPYAGRLESRGLTVRRVSADGVPSGGAGVIDGILTLDFSWSPMALCRADELLVRGKHNISNALAAAAAVAALGVPAKEIAEGLKTFAPIEHRIEPAGVVDGVEFFNDSKATNPDSVLKALLAFEGTPLVLLLGGRNKGNDFRPLAVECVGRCRGVVAFGEARGEVLAAFEGLEVGIAEAPGLLEAIDAARGMAREGDAVLLSPACASFDEFTSYEHRGRVFKDAVAGLAGGKG